MGVKKKSDNSKPGENRGRKANGSKVTQVTMIARPPKNNRVCFDSPDAASLDFPRLAVFFQASSSLT